VKDEKDTEFESKPGVFDGILRQPIEDVDPLVRALWKYNTKAETRAAIDKEIAEFMSAQYAERVMALAEHYRIDSQTMDPPAFLYSLLIRLAKDFVVGFRFGGRRKMPGRPKETGKDRNEELCKEVWRLRSRGLSVRSACTALANQAKYRGEKPSALQARFNRYESNLIKGLESGSDNYKALRERVKAIKAASR
jgi:hypothetical protein